MVFGLLGAAHASCPLSFQRIGRGCYFYGYFKLNWFRAMEFCHSFGRGASLATLDTPGENRKIKTWLLEHGEQSFYLQHFEVLVFLGDDTLENFVQNDIVY